MANLKDQASVTGTSVSLPEITRCPRRIAIRIQQDFTEYQVMSMPPECPE